MFGLGFWELIMVLGIVTFIFGRKRIPELPRQIKRAITGFQKGIKGEQDDRPVRDVEEIKPK